LNQEGKSVDISTDINLILHIHATAPSGPIGFTSTPRRTHAHTHAHTLCMTPLDV